MSCVVSRVNVAPVPDHLTRARIDVIWHRHTPAQVILSENGETGLGNVSLKDNAIEESSSTCIDLERLCLKDNLDDTIEDREDEVKECELGECDAVCLQVGEETLARLVAS